MCRDLRPCLYFTRIITVLKKEKNDHIRTRLDAHYLGWLSRFMTHTKLALLSYVLRAAT